MHRQQDDIRRLIQSSQLLVILMVLVSNPKQIAPKKSVDIISGGRNLDRLCLVIISNENDHSRLGGIDSEGNHISFLKT